MTLGEIQGTLKEVRGTLWEVCWTLSQVRGTVEVDRDGSGDHWGGSGRVGGPPWKVRDRLGLVSGPWLRFETCRGTLGEVLDGSWYPRGVPGRPRGCPEDPLGGPGHLGEIRGTIKKSGGPSWRSEEPSGRSREP